MRSFARFGGIRRAEEPRTAASDARAKPSAAGGLPPPSGHTVAAAAVH